MLIVGLEVTDPSSIANFSGHMVMGLDKFLIIIQLLTVGKLEEFLAPDFASRFFVLKHPHHQNAAVHVLEVNKENLELPQVRVSALGLVDNANFV